MGHGKAFSVVCADGGIYGISLATRSDTSVRQLCSTLCRLPRKMKTMFYMELRAISGCRKWKP
eukprot:6202714-Pleurochrysis_carterae.AAC.3